MSLHVSDSEFESDLKQPGRGVRISAVLSAAMHAFLWGCVAMGMTYVVPWWAKVSQDFGVELNVIQALTIDLSFLMMRLWPIGLVGIIIAAVADWWILEWLTTRSSNSLARLYFWANVALPILVAVGIGVTVATSMVKIIQELS